MAQDKVFLGPHHVDPVRTDSASYGTTASEAITPGELIEFGGSNDIQKHSTAGGNARKMFALENDLIGEGIDDDYASGDSVQAAIIPRGGRVNALLGTGGSEVNIAKGVALESAGDGTLQQWDTAGQATDPASTPVQVDQIIGYALEAVDNSSGTSEARIKIEVA